MVDHSKAWEELFGNNSKEFKTYQENFKEETFYRDNIDFSKLCTWGIKSLDDSLLALAPEEVIIVGASSGSGKTELLNITAEQNALKGKKIAIYPLEDGSRGYISRMKWRSICNKYYEKYSGLGIDLDYRTWSLNKDIDPVLRKIESEVYEQYNDVIGKNLFFYDGEEGLTCDKFCKSLANLEGLRGDFKINKNIRMNAEKLNGIDLIIIDHLHYFSLNKDEKEIQEITEIMQTVKKISKELNIPIILAAHLKKIQRGHGVPDKEDIYGTGNIHKVANTCLILHPDYENDNVAEGLYPTYIRIVKSRQGMKPNLLLRSSFDITTRKYEDYYSLHLCNGLGQIADEPLKYEDYPKWAKRK